MEAPAQADSPAIRASGLGKAYRIWSSPSGRLGLPLARAAASLLPAPLRPASLERGLWRGRPAYRDFHALRDVSFTVARGEAVGIVGRNGSGKSTLLQLIAGTLSPSEGSVATVGRVAALLELGSGFNPEFSGRENVMLNATVLGLSPAEIASRFDSIVAYSEIGDFIEQPVRTYSSGMMLRLAFSVAAHVDPDVLIIDEALGVGDARFQLKCARTIDQFRERGVTLFFVSHDASAIKRLCSRALLLERGMLVHEGPPNEVVNLYSKLTAEGGSLEAIAGDIAALRARRASRAPAALPVERAEPGRAGAPGAEALRASPHEARQAEPLSASSSSPAADPELGSPSSHSTFGPQSRSELARLRGRVAELEALVRSFEAGGIDGQRAQALLASEPVLPPGATGEFSYGGELGVIESIQTLDAQGRPRTLFTSGEQLRVQVLVRAHEALPDPIYALTLKGSTGVEVYGTNTLFSGQPAGPIGRGETRIVEFSLPLDLMMGTYFLSLGFTHFVGNELVIVHRRYDASHVEVVGADRTFGVANLHARISVSAPQPPPP